MRLFFFPLILLLSSCSHALEVQNMEKFQPEQINSLLANATLGVHETEATDENLRLVRATINQLKMTGFKVIYPLTVENNKNLDYKISIRSKNKFEGDGVNFWINFPGFLIWTPVWHGYHYKATFDFAVEVYDLKKEEYKEVNVPIELYMRHANTNRTWTQFSWLEVGVIAIAGGVAFTKYDRSVTPILLDRFESRLGDYISSKIAASILDPQKNLEITPYETILAPAISN